MSDINKGDFINNRLKFGTAGIRAEMKRGADFLNAGTVKKIADGTADFLLSLKDTNADKKSVVICYDNRKNSRAFACICARAFVSRGFTAYLPNRCAPTPYLSFAVRHLGAAAGIMITASHNTKEYNGYKLYGADGCQLTDSAAENVSQFIACQNQKIKKKVVEDKKESESFSYYVQNGNIKTFDLSSLYLKTVTAQLGADLNSVKKSGLKIVYTPLCGVGGAWAKKLFKNNPDFFVVPEEFKPDSKFTSCPIPNPEKKEAYAAAIRQAQKINANLILANDPDADRLGVMVRSADGYRLFSGNETGVLLLQFLLEENRKLSEKNIKNNIKNVKKERDCAIQRPLAVRTFVSTPLADKLINDFGGEIVTVPTGFKYVGEVIAGLEKKGEENRFLLGFEESHGYLSGTYVRDKDGLLAAALIASCAAKLKNNGQTLDLALEDIYKRYGYYKHKTLSYKLCGLDKINLITARLRGGENIPGLLIDGIKDYLKNDGKYRPDMLELSVPDGKIIIRPSGTEPLIKVYLTAKHSSMQKSEELIDNFEKVCNKYFSDFFL